MVLDRVVVTVAVQILEAAVAVAVDMVQELELA